jgi:hypothetical protein
MFHAALHASPAPLYRWRDAWEHCAFMFWVLCYNLDLASGMQTNWMRWAVRAKRAVPLEAGWVFDWALHWRARFYFRITN